MTIAQRDIQSIEYSLKESKTQVTEIMYKGNSASIFLMNPCGNLSSWKSPLHTPVFEHFFIIDMGLFFF